VAVITLQRDMTASALKYTQHQNRIAILIFKDTH